MKNRIEIEAPAKINLGLDITGRRDDGYHLVDMVMQAVALSDTVTVECCEGDGASVRFSVEEDPEHPVKGVPTGDDNLVVRAAKLLLDKRLSPGEGTDNGPSPAKHPELTVDIRLTKRIPMAAGLAGGSTDAAAVMIAVNTLLDQPFTEDELMELGLTLGADIPYCISSILSAKGGHPTTMRARGTGELLERLNPLSDCHIVIAKPGISVSTAWAYKTYDSMADTVKRPDIDGLCKALETGTLTDIVPFSGNVLEEVTAKAHPEINAIEDILRESGSILARMSGSGPSVFGIFDDAEKARLAMSRLSESGLLADSDDGSCALILTSPL